MEMPAIDPDDLPSSPSPVPPEDTHRFILIDFESGQLYRVSRSAADSKVVADYLTQKGLNQPVVEGEEPNATLRAQKTETGSRTTTVRSSTRVPFAAALPVPFADAPPDCGDPIGSSELYRCEQDDYRINLGIQETSHTGSFAFPLRTVGYTGCTATMIGPKEAYALTAAHCVVAADGGFINFNFQPRRDADVLPYGTWRSTLITVPEAYMANGCFNSGAIYADCGPYDTAIAQVERFSADARFPGSMGFTTQVLITRSMLWGFSQHKRYPAVLILDLACVSAPHGMQEWWTL